MSSVRPRDQYWSVLRIQFVTPLRLVIVPTDGALSACLHFWNPQCLYRVLDKWPTSRTPFSSRTQKTPLYWKSSFNAQNTRMGDVYKVGKRIQSVINSPHSIYLMPYADSDIIYVNALGTSVVVLNSYKVATDLLDEKSGIYSSRYVGILFPKRMCGVPCLLYLDHTLRCSMNCEFVVSHLESDKTDATVIDPAGALPLLYFPMEMSGGQVASYSQNISIPPTPVSTNRTI